MRFLLHTLLLTATAAFVAWTVDSLRTGQKMREMERIAAGHVESILLAQEKHRTDQVDRSAVLYVSVADLMKEKLLSGFTLARDTGKKNIYERDGYYFQLNLLPSQDSSSPIVKLGQRYELWSWPADRDNLNLVLYYGSNAGYLIQGENGEVTGLHPVLPPTNPIRALDPAGTGGSGRASRRWTVLKNIRQTSSS